MHPTRIIDSHELIFVVQGELNMWEAHRVFTVRPGQTLHLWPGRRHGSTCPMPPDLKFYWIHFEVEDQDQNDTDIAETQSYTPPLAIPQHAEMPRPESLERFFRIFLSAQETGTLRPLSANLLTMLMLQEVAQQSHERYDPPSANVVATWAHTYIRMNFDRAITASKVAKALGYNVDYLGRIYRQTYDCTLTQAIQRHRIHKACEYLLYSNLTITQIASRCGFSDSDYFRRIFKRFMKISPGDYRDENSRLHITTH